MLFASLSCSMCENRFEIHPELQGTVFIFIKNLIGPIPICILWWIVGRIHALGTKTYFLYQRMTLEILKCFAYESSTYRDNFPGRLIIQWKLLLLLLELTCLDLVFMVILTWKIVLDTHSTAFIWKLYWKSNIYNIINVLNVLLPRTYVKYKLAGHNYS